MNPSVKSELFFTLDPTNPGQFFACCGLLELAHRLWPEGVRGAFSDFDRVFRITVPGRANGNETREYLVKELASCPLRNIMTPTELRQRKELAGMKASEIKAVDREGEKKELDSSWRESPVVLGSPFNLTIDWHQDDRAGGSTFKTWAGQQSIIDIAAGMQALGAASLGALADLANVLNFSSTGSERPFNFDSDLGGQGAALDVGFSFDPLPGLKVAVRPLLELCAFVGLQRFRPTRMGRENRYCYATWNDELVPSVASVAAAGLLCPMTGQGYEFRLLYRTKYLKSFLSAQPM